MKNVDEIIREALRPQLEAEEAERVRLEALVRQYAETVEIQAATVNRQADTIDSLLGQVKQWQALAAASDRDAERLIAMTQQVIAITETRYPQQLSPVASEPQ